MINLLYKFLPVLLITNSLFLAGFVSNFFRTQIASNHQEEKVLGVTLASPTPSRVPATQPSPRISSLPKLIPTPASTPTPKPTSTSTPEPKTIITNNYYTIAASPSPNPIPSLTPTPTPSPTPSPTPISTPTPIPVNSINIEIKTPQSDTNFDLQIEDGINACDGLVKAKNEGKISSLGLDDSYLSTFNTLLVREINGLSNYWVFTVNGKSPMGCSLVSLHNHDQIVWEFIDGGN